jgi:hypothetical protein
MKAWPLETEILDQRWLKLIAQPIFVTMNKKAQLFRSNFKNYLITSFWVARSTFQCIEEKCTHFKLCNFIISYMCSARAD